MNAVAANTVGLQGCSLYKIRNSGHSPGSDSFRFLIKLVIEKPQVSELEVSLLFFAERAGSLLYSTLNSNLHTKAAGQAEALFMLHVTQSLMLTLPIRTNSHWQQWANSLDNKKCHT